MKPKLASEAAFETVIEVQLLDALRSSAELTNRLLKERLSALISAALKGKIAISGESGR